MDYADKKRMHEKRKEERKKKVNGKSDNDRKTQFLKKPSVTDTDIESPIQGPVMDEKPLFTFVQQNHDSAVAKMWGVFLDDNYMVLGIEPLAFGDNAAPEQFNTAALFHYYSVFFAKRFILMSYRYNATDDPAPTDADKKLIETLQMQAKIMNNADFSNYAIFAGDRYWSTRQQNGTACHCGSQDYMPED